MRIALHMFLYRQEPSILVLLYRDADTLLDC